MNSFYQQGFHPDPQIWLDFHPNGCNRRFMVSQAGITSAARYVNSDNIIFFQRPILVRQFLPPRKFIRFTSGTAQPKQKDPQILSIESIRYHILCFFHIQHR